MPGKDHAQDTRSPSEPSFSAPDKIAEVSPEIAKAFLIQLYTMKAEAEPGFCVGW